MPGGLLFSGDRRILSTTFGSARGCSFLNRAQLPSPRSAASCSHMRAKGSHTRYALFCIAATLPLLGLGQGAFVYDQQSSDERVFGGAASIMQSSAPVGQSFAPQFTSIDFVRLHFL